MGNYDAPEASYFIGLQDKGHSHFDDSLILGRDVENVMISGSGMIDGSYLEDGIRTPVIAESDSSEVSYRGVAGSAKGATKAISFVNAKNIIFSGFKVLYGGHIAILGSNIDTWTVDGVTIDSNRDGMDIDNVQNVTIRNSTVNTVRDDAIVLKATFSEGSFIGTSNVLIDNCTVSGYDVGTVIAGTYGTKRKGPDVGPIGRVKLGTESTGGFDTVTVQNITFERSRGFAIETVDGAALKNIIFRDSTMKNISNSPIFIDLSDRGRAPVTGSTTSTSTSPSNTVRINDLSWVLPNVTDTYGSFPATRYIPSYNRDTTTQVTNGGSFSDAIDETSPTNLNSASIYPSDPLYANGIYVGYATLENVAISNITATDVDPRFPILITGLVDHPIKNVSISNVSVAYRGGLKLIDSVENRKLYYTHKYTAYQLAKASEVLYWGIGNYGNEYEGRFPRIGWNATTSEWEDDPYNIPESPTAYPEPFLYGILPAYGMYARHVVGLNVDNVTFTYGVGDGRVPVVLDDVQDSSFTNFSADKNTDLPDFVFVTNYFKRPAHLELVLNQAYQTTTVSNVSTPTDLTVEDVIIGRPAPGTPRDTLYGYPTFPTTDYPYSYGTSSNDDFEWPSTVFPDE